MSDRIVLLGTKGGPAIRGGGPSPTSSLLIVDETPYVIDCGLGVTRGFVEAGFRLTDLKTILITHHHSDHNLEFGNLLHTVWTAGLSRPVTAYGPTGLHDMANDFLRLNRFDIETRIADEGRVDFAGLLDIREYADGLVFDDGKVKVTALRNHHPPIVDSFALRFEFGGRCVVFSGDTAFLPELAAFAKGADLLVHEALYGPGVDALVARVKNGSRLREHLLASHTLAEDVGRIATLAGVKQLALHHLVPADDPDITEQHWRTAVANTFTGPLHVGRDGMVIPVAP